ncbi:hypothetical protein HOP60_09665 [Halomonas daqingensis]|uniref:Uncharacterized protein n=1 Tax=Billgrantia desiderata TaxID=52021 RepID=A0ABS9B4K4_9GAMM|nr:hypothetical protein [Halomonas desiderata]MCE8042420.1 hypothetical protein [Halomonas desiderata]MCE8046995.1 hypothetical protein [Halomonas desiderata]
MDTIETRLTDAIVSYYRRNEGRWPGHVVVSVPGRNSLRAAAEKGCGRYEDDALRPGEPERYMGIPIKADSALGDDEIVLKDEPA